MPCGLIGIKALLPLSSGWKCIHSIRTIILNFNIGGLFYNDWRSLYLHSCSLTLSILWYKILVWAENLQLKWLSVKVDTVETQLPNHWLSDIHFYPLVSVIRILYYIYYHLVYSSHNLLTTKSARKEMDNTSHLIQVSTV